MKSKWIEHKGKRIFFVDLADFGSDSAALHIEAQAIIDLVTKQPENSVRALTNAHGTVGNMENISILKSVVTRTSRYVRRRAVFGVSGVRKTLVDIVNRATNGKPFASFADEASAKDWLIND